MRFRGVIGAFSGILLAASCSLGNPEDVGSINLYLDVDKGTLPAESSMNITVRALNVGYDPVTLTGPSDCLLYVEVLSNQGQIVWHSQGQCIGATVTEELVPGSEKTHNVTWDGTNLAGARLPAGFYHIRGIARVTGSSYIGPPLSVSIE